VAGRLLALLQSRPRLIVSLPRNSPDLALAAADGGAEALKVHINVHHDASDTHFGTLAEEHASLEEILDVGLPTGIVPGVATSLPSPEDMAELARMGVDFFDLYDHDMPAWMLRIEDLTRTIAASSATPLESVAQFEAMGFDMLEAAVVPHDGYGQMLSAADLAAYRRLRKTTSLPVIVPTQRAIRPDDVSAVLATGVNAVMIGAVVTGREGDSLRAATQHFAAALAEAVR
jgi:putative N-acetylmannosamine-6-phosphate epimerase